MNDQLKKQVIENIRQIRFGIGLDCSNLPDNVLKSLEDKNKIIKDAARLASDMHTARPHFILELIQNAEDNHYEQNVKPKIKLIIRENQLILQNNEKGFFEDNVWALCGIGETTKRKISGYIGEKGIGFKSVFRVSNKPHIFSNDFQFEFEYDEKDPISIIVPHWVDDIPEYVKRNITNIILPIKDELKGEFIQFTKIDPCLLLFLHKIKSIEIEDKIQNREEKIERHDFEGRVEITHSEGRACWKIVNSGRLKVPEHIKEEKRRDVTETEIVLAFPLEPDGSANIQTSQNVFVYLPVRSYGFKFIIQADFLLPPSREDIHKDKPWNNWLRDNIASVFLHAIEEFKKDDNLQKTFYYFIPIAGNIIGDFFLPVISQIYNALQETDFILTETGSWQKPADVFFADDVIRKLISNNELKALFRKEYVSNKLTSQREIDTILLHLNVQIFGIKHLVRCLQNTKWVDKQNDNWFIRLYTYLMDKTKELDFDEFKRLKIIRLESGQLTSTVEKNIFFPFDKKGNYGFEKELPIAKRTLFESIDKETKSAVEELFRKLGVKKASPYEIIENHILPIYESGDESSNWQSRERTVTLGYIRYIKDNLEEYEREGDKLLNADKKHWEGREDPLERLRNALWIRSNKPGGNRYRKPAYLYLSKKVYKNEYDLETLFENSQDVSFVHREYVDDIIEKYRREKRKNKKSKEVRKKREAEIKKWKDFFIKLVVNAIPKVNIKEELRQHITYANIYERKVTIYSSPDICSIVEEKDAEKNKQLAKILDQNWDHYNKYTTWHNYYYNRGWKYEEKLSDWFFELKTSSWLPTAKGTLFKPSEVYVDKSAIKELLGDSVPYLAIDIKNEKLINALGINSEVTVEGILNYVKQLRVKNTSSFVTIYEFLNKNFEDNEEIIQDTFSKNRLIFIPDDYYFTSREVLWKDVSNIFGEYRGYLEKHYPKLKTFFVEKLGVSERPTPRDYADVLIRISKKGKIDTNSEKIIRKIYDELNTHLDPENNEQQISEQDWWEDFISKPIFWTDKKEFWANKGNIYVNDNEELCELFKNKPQVAFLSLPKNYYPKIQHFINASNISYLSKAMKANLGNVESTEIEPNLTKQIQKFTPYIRRYLFKLDNKTYERLDKNGTLSQLSELTCYSAGTLHVEYILNQQTASAQRAAFLDKGKLYVHQNNIEDTDFLAVELAKLLGSVRGLDDFLISLFEKKTEDKIEHLLKAKGIPELPVGEQESALTTGQPTPLIEGAVELEEEKGKATKVERFPPVAIDVPMEKETATLKAEIASEKFDIQRTKDFSDAEAIRKTDWQPEYAPEEAVFRLIEIELPEPKEEKSSDVEGITYRPHEPLFVEEKVQDTLSPSAKKDIGKWGEGYVYKGLKEKYCDQYPEGNLIETEEGFTISSNEKTMVEVQWRNKRVDMEEGYDIKVIMSDDEIFIEVKSTKTDSKDWFEMSRKQWEFAQEKGDNYHVYRVYNAGIKQQVQCGIIINPAKLWREGRLKAYPTRIQI